MKKFRPVLLSFDWAFFYLILVRAFIGLRLEHFLLTGLIVGCYCFAGRTRHFVEDFIPFALFGALYDFLRIFPKEWAGAIHVVGPYLLEQKLFGYSCAVGRCIPTDFFKNVQHPVLTVVTSLAYSLHMVVPLILAFCLWVKDRRLTQQFAWAFFLANLFAFATYLFFPAAPPWYVEIYGLKAADWSIPPNAAGLLRFDQIIHFPYFAGVYAKSAWVFGAIPSMHAGFPVLEILFAHKIFKKGVWPFYLFMLTVWFAAVYLRHHYVIDLLSGALYVLAAYFLVTLITRRKLHAVSS